MDIRKVKKLIDLVKATNIAELEIHEGEEAVKITHGTLQPAAAMAYVPPPSIETVEAPEATGYMVHAPMVGTVYLAATPGSKPFVTIGQKVKIGDTLCLIEAMKMFNQVEADRSGVISSCMVENGDPVEYEQPLFVIEEE